MHKKIDLRTEKMFKEGAVEEVQKYLKMDIRRELTSNKIIGINEIKGYLSGKTEAFGKLYLRNTNKTNI